MSDLPSPSSGTQVVHRLALLCALAVTACTIGSGGPPVPASKLAVGDHWTYRITDNLRRGIVSTLDAEVSSIHNGLATIRLVYTDSQGVLTERIEEIDANGGLAVGTLKPSEVSARHYPSPIELYNFPLAAGTTWRQVVDTISPDTGLDAQILVYGTVQGQSQVTVPAGTFNSVYFYRILQLDDEQFWRTRTTRRDSVWYAPESKAPAKEMRDAEYIESGIDMAPVRTEYTVRELVSFRPGRG